MNDYSSTMNVILFGDQTADPQQFLTKVLRRKGSPLLSSFLEQAQVVLQEEISSQSPSHRRELPAFSNVAEFVERYYKADQPNIAIESTVTCLAQLVHFIGVSCFPKFVPKFLAAGICRNQILGGNKKGGKHR
jgi:hypothetical protein